MTEGSEFPLPVSGRVLGLVCVAGGRGQRYGRDKLAEVLGETTVLESSLAALRVAFSGAPTALVLPADRMEFWRKRLENRFSDLLWIEGGARRQDSVRRGVGAVADRGATVAVVHDAARPLVDPRDIRAVVEALGAADGSILGSPVIDTVKRIDARGAVVETIPRTELFMAQTPQVFRVESLRRAWQEGDFDDEWTDEAAFLESLGRRIVTVAAHFPNPKLTKPGDLAVLRALLAGRA